MNKDNTKYIDLFEKEIVDILVEYNLWDTSKFTLFLECLVKLELKKILFTIFEKNLDS